MLWFMSLFQNEACANHFNQAFFRQNETTRTKRNLSKYTYLHNSRSYVNISPQQNHSRMTKIAELKDRGSVVAWSPLSEYADVLALGTKVGSSFLRCSFICLFLLLHLKT